MRAQYGAKDDNEGTIMHSEPTVRIIIYTVSPLLPLSHLFFTSANTRMAQTTCIELQARPALPVQLIALPAQRIATMAEVCFHLRRFPQSTTTVIVANSFF